MSSSRVVAGATGATGAASTGVEDTTTGAGAAATSALGAAALRVAFFTGAASTATGAGAGASTTAGAAFFATRGVFAGAVFIIPEDEELEDILLRTNDFLVKSRINFFRNNQLFLIKYLKLFFFFEIHDY